MPVAKSIHLFGVERIHRKSPLNQILHHGAARRLDGNSDAARLTFGQLCEHICQLSQSGPAMFDRAALDHLLLSVKHAYRVFILRPIDSHEKAICTVRTIPTHAVLGMSRNRSHASSAARNCPARGIYYVY